MDDEATQQQQSNVGLPSSAGRRSDERDGVEATEAAQPLVLGPDEGLPSSGSKVCPPQPAV